MTGTAPVRLRTNNMKLIKLMSLVRLLAIILGLSTGGAVGHAFVKEEKTETKIESKSESTKSESDSEKSKSKKAEKDDDDKEEEHEDKDDKGNDDD